MATPYLDHFLETLSPLPAELLRNFNLMRDCDQRTDELVNKISGNAEEYLNKAYTLQPSEKVDRMKSINEMFDKAKEYSDDKVQLATQTYEMVDKHIRRLDTELAKFEADLKDKQLQQQNSAKNNKGTTKFGNQSDTGKKGRGRNKKVSPKGSSKDDSKGKIRKKGMKVPKEEPQPAASTPFNSICGVGSGVIASPEVLVDMPVDPNEPTYCICHQVSYGEMIGCDNSDCAIEWFHFACVGLTSKPKGKWYCPNCKSKK